MNIRKSIRPLLLILLAGSVVLSSCTSTDTVATRNGSGAVRKKTTVTRENPRTSATRVNHMVLNQSTKSNTRVVIDVADQKGYLLVNNKIAVEAPVSTARPGKWTPRGSFNMSERIRSGKISTIYGVHMPYWMRLSGSAYGVHAGHLPGYPASAGCIRLPAQAAQIIFDNTTYGTRVNVYSSWNGA